MNNLNYKSAITTALIFSLISFSAHATGGDMPWEGPLTSIANSINGPVARALGVMAIIACGIAIAVGEGSGGMKKLLWVAFGLSIAFSAATFFLGFLGFGGGAVF